MKKTILQLFTVFLFSTNVFYAQHSVARQWNDVLLDAIRTDYSRPTVHSRNLFHTALAMYDAWALFDDQAEPFFLGKTFQNYQCSFDGIATPVDVDVATHTIMSYAMFRILNHRFANSPGSDTALPLFLELFNSYNYDPNFISTDYSNGSYAALGNYLASEIIAFGNQDSSNEQNDYANEFYYSTNPPLILDYYEDDISIDPDHWQPLAFDFFIDQAGYPHATSTPDFLSPEWGDVSPFCLQPEDLQILNGGFDSYVYNDPGPPVYIQNSINEDGLDDPYKWHFALVALWSSHLDPNDNTLIDISPNTLGNIDVSSFPETFEDYKAFYDFSNGGGLNVGHTINPKTNMPYTPQMVKRSDYARVLAEFWADGPESETPPGHWFTILNYVSDHQETVKRFNGQGPIISDLEWDVKSYITLGGAMHDVAINTWGIKGYYDYIRPISAIRYMCSKGQSSDNTTPQGIASYNPHGIPLVPGYIEIINADDALAIEDTNNIGKIKIKAWKGPDYITNPDTDIAGVDWILGTRWWPYQRGTFVTPPFAGYLSGHSTFSRAAAEVLTLVTGDAFFPGGMGTFDITQNDFLVFEEGPSESFTLQWATYRDASDQTSLSRIWGGIHPPIDDIRGRLIGEKIGVDAFNYASSYFNGTLSNTEITSNSNQPQLYPVPFSDTFTIKLSNNNPLHLKMYSIDGKLVLEQKITTNSNLVDTNALASGAYIVQLKNENNLLVSTKKIIKSY